MSTELEEIKSKADEAFGNLESLVKDLKEAQANGDGQDRINALSAKAEELGTEVAALKQKQADAEAAEAAESRIRAIEDRMTDLAKDVRTPSKAAAVLGEVLESSSSADSFFSMLAMAQNPKAPTYARAQAEKALLDMGSRYMTTDEIASKIAAGGGEYSKATLGDTDAAGGYLAPRAVVAEMTQVASANNPFRRLLTVVTGIAGPTVEVPHVGLAPTRAVVIARGVTKTNASVALSNYSATFYTLAVIHDAANQWLRQTKGAGEKLLRERGADAIAQGEAYYVLNGSGSSEPKGLLTSLGTSGTFVTSHTYSQSTVAGNQAAAIAKAAAAVAGRNRTATGVVMNSSDFWVNLAGGANDAGYYIAPNGPNTVDATGAFSDGSPAMRIWGLPVFITNQIPTDSLVVGDFKSAELYVGEDLRIDTSSEAGDRWDKNLTGFRFEEDIAFNADPYVAAGFFQRIIDATA